MPKCQQSIGAIKCDRDTKQNADTLDENPIGALQWKEKY